MGTISDKYRVWASSSDVITLNVIIMLAIKINFFFFFFGIIFGVSWLNVKANW